MNKIIQFLILLAVCNFISCSHEKKDISAICETKTTKIKDTIIVDCNYTFEEATAGTNAPEYVLNELELIDVQYYSTDGKIHTGQILTNKKMVHKLTKIFDFMFRAHFPIAHAIPIVKYNWDDNLSMQANNTYSFCYRNVSYSKHARGMAIDINPFFNPVRWKVGYKYRTDEPVGAVYNPKVMGTFFSSHLVIQEFNKYGFRWGHSFKRNYDDHHFEM